MCVYKSLLCISDITFLKDNAKSLGPVLKVFQTGGLSC